jgi:D-alanyl-D-alanine carboxypeptidase (penicillin-binding protein 5/6)
MTRTWSARAAVAGLVTVAALLTAALPATADAAARPVLPKPPACATAVAVSSGTTTSKPVPLPAPASDTGGAQLARPGVQVALPAGVARPPALRAAAWVVADLATGNVLASCNAHVPLAPASTLKVLTALSLHGRIDRSQRYVARPEDAGVDGTKVGLSPGSVYTVADLWHGLLMGSGNDCANALAALAGGMPAASRLMTDTARSLGARDTVVANTSGLDAAGQVTSAYDLALFGRALLRDPALAALVRTKTYAFPGKGKVFGKARKTYQIQNHDLLLYRYPGATGIKNGFTTAAGASFVGSATRAGHSYLVALLRSDYDSWRLGAALLTWAFANGGQAAPVGTLNVPAADAAPQRASTVPPTAATTDGTSPQPRVPHAVSGPVKATLQTVPAGSRTGWLLAALAVALAGGAVVRRLARRRLLPRTTRSASRRPTSGSGSRTTRSAPRPRVTSAPRRASARTPSKRTSR